MPAVVDVDGHQAARRVIMPDPDPRRLMTMVEPGPPVVMAPLPMVPVLAVVVAVVPIEAGRAHHGIESWTRIVDDEHPVWIAIAILLDRDAAGIDGVAGATIPVRVQGRAAAEEQQAAYDRYQTHHRRGASHRRAPKFVCEVSSLPGTGPQVAHLGPGTRAASFTDSILQIGSERRLNTAVGAP